MKKAVKLTQAQLRSIIQEMIHGRGGPEGNFELVEAVTDAFREKLAWAFPYDEGDPSMGHLGEEAWNIQLEGAVMHFQNDVSDVIDNIVTKLINGEYHSG